MTEVERFWRELAHDPETPGRIKAWREHRHHTQRTLASAASCAVTTINEIETGKRPPRVSTLKHLAGALRLEPWMLRCEPGDPDVLAARIEDMAADLEQAIDAYEASGRDAAAFVANRTDDYGGYVPIDTLDRIRGWIIKVFPAAGWSPAGTGADFAARLTGRQAELAQATADYQAVVDDILAEAQNEPRAGSIEDARETFGEVPITC